MKENRNKTRGALIHFKVKKDTAHHSSILCDTHTANLQAQAARMFPANTMVGALAAVVYGSCYIAITLNLFIVSLCLN